MKAAGHIFQTQPGARKGERVVFGLFRGATYFVLLCGAAILATIVFKGVGSVTIDFLTKSPETLYVFDFEGKHYAQGNAEYRVFLAAHPAAANAKTESYAYSSGGIFPCIVGTVLLVSGSMLIALFLGVCAAVYLNEYARDGKFIRFVRLAILNLAGVPSIVFGLFGAAMFVSYFGWSTSVLAGWFTLAFMVLPVIITASEESLKAVPKGFREGSLALGATKWQTIRTNVLPYALPGILTSSILGIARVAGETAPILYTAAVGNSSFLPWQNLEKVGDFFFRAVMALPYHIYVVSSKIPQNEYTEKVQYGTAFVFLVVVALIATTSIVLRNQFRNRYKW